MSTRIAVALAASILVASPLAKSQPSDFESIVRLAKSRDRDAWRAAAHSLGELARGSAEARERVWREARVNTLGMKLAEVPHGSFEMGPDVHRVFAMKPAHEVEITRDFFIDVTEVTNEEMQAVLGDFSPHPQFSPDPDSPAVNVDAETAALFCRKLSEHEGVTYRLPTEAEWEYSCRAGSDTLFSFGSSAADLSRHGWTAGRSRGRAARVALLEPNEWGLFDMHGNAVEWTSDWYSESEYAKRAESGVARDPRGPESGPSRVLRGGGWPAKEPLACSSTARMPFPLLGRRAVGGEPPLICVVGFRVVREAAERGAGVREGGRRAR